MDKFDISIGGFVLFVLVGMCGVLYSTEAGAQGIACAVLVLLAIVSLIVVVATKSN